MLIAEEWKQPSSSSPITDIRTLPVLSLFRIVTINIKGWQLKAKTQFCANDYE